MNRSLSVSSTATQVSPEVSLGLCNSTRTRSRSLNDLPGGLRVPLLRRPERLKPRIQATLAGLEELRLLKEQHRNLVDEAKFGLKTRSVSNSDMQDLFVKQTYEWLSSCRDRSSVSNLEKINEESGKEEKNTMTIECTRNNRKSPDANMATLNRRQIQRPVSVSGYPTIEQSRRSASELCNNSKSPNQQLEKTNQTEHDKTLQPEKFSTMRRASFQCHVVLTKQKGKMPPMSASHEYPSPMHAVMRQYQSKIGDDKEKAKEKEKNDKNESTISNRGLSQPTGSRDSASGVTVVRRSSFTDSNRALSQLTGSRENATVVRRSSFTDSNRVPNRYTGLKENTNGVVVARRSSFADCNRTISNQTRSRENTSGVSVVRRSSFTDSNRVIDNQTGLREGTKSVTIIRRSSFTARSTNQKNDQNSFSNFVFSPGRRKHDHEKKLNPHKSIETIPYNSLVGQEPLNKQNNEANQVEVTGLISSSDTSRNRIRDSNVLQQEPPKQKGDTELEERKDTDSSQTDGRTLNGNSSSQVSNIKLGQKQSQVRNPQEKLTNQYSSDAEIYSEYQNLKDLERCRIHKTEPIHSNESKKEPVHSNDSNKEPIQVSDSKRLDNQAESPMQLSLTEKNKNFLNLKGDSYSYTSDEGYCASLSSTPSGRRQLSIQSDVSWISADIDDSRSCDSNVISYKNSCGSQILHGVHVQKLGRKPSFSRCKNSIITPQNDQIHASKVLPFRQTSL